MKTITKLFLAFFTVLAIGCSSNDDTTTNSSENEPSLTNSNPASYYSNLGLTFMGRLSGLQQFNEIYGLKVAEGSNDILVQYGETVRNSNTIGDRAKKFNVASSINLSIPYPTGINLNPDNSRPFIMYGFTNDNLCQNNYVVSYTYGGASKLVRVTKKPDDTTEQIGALDINVAGSNDIYTKFSKNGTFLSHRFYGESSNQFEIFQIKNNNWENANTTFIPDTNLNQYESIKYRTVAVDIAAGQPNQYDYMVSITKDYNPNGSFGNGLDTGYLRLDRISFSGGTFVAIALDEIKMTNIWQGGTTNPQGYRIMDPLKCKLIENPQNPDEPLMYIHNTVNNTAKMYKVQDNKLILWANDILSGFPANKSGIDQWFWNKNILYVSDTSLGVGNVYQYNGSWSKVNLPESPNFRTYNYFFSDKQGILGAVITGNGAEYNQAVDIFKIN
jgi:hypothetical protein